MSKVTGIQAPKRKQTQNTSKTENLNASIGAVSNAVQSSTSAELLKSSLVEFYRYPTHLERILPIINRATNQKISLRLLDHFVVNYAAMHQISYALGDKIFEVHKSYDAQLGKYHKTLFDPFRRGGSSSRIILCTSDREQIETTLGQLCFFRWCLQNGIIEYVEKHVNAITEHMKFHTTRNCLLSDRTTLTNDSSSISSSSSTGTAGSRRTSRRRSSGNDVIARRTPLNGAQRYVVRFD